MKTHDENGCKIPGVSANDIKLNKGFNSDSYLNLLEHRAFPSIDKKIRNFIFMQDNSPVHTKKPNKGSKHSLSRNLIVDVLRKPILKWPAYSPDLNPIENVWFLLDNAKNEELARLSKLEQQLPRNKKEMFDLLKRCWNALDNNIVIKIVNSFKNRLEKVVLNKGKNNFSTKS